MHAVAYIKNAISPCYVYIQVREVGLPGPMDPALIPVGMVPEQAPETAPLLTILTAVLETAPSTKHVEIVAATVSIACADTCLPPCLYINLGLYPITRPTDSNSRAINPMQAE